MWILSSIDEFQMPFLVIFAFLFMCLSVGLWILRSLFGNSTQSHYRGGVWHSRILFRRALSLRAASRYEKVSHPLRCSPRESFVNISSDEVGAPKQNHCCFRFVVKYHSCAQNLALLHHLSSSHQSPKRSTNPLNWDPTTQSSNCASWVVHGSQTASTYRFWLWKVFHERIVS